MCLHHCLDYHPEDIGTLMSWAGGGDRDLDNPSYDTKAKFTSCIIIHLK